MYKKGFIFIGLVSALFLCVGCQTPYSGILGPEDFNGWVESETDGFVCLWNGFDRICVLAIPGPPGKDGTDGRDGKDGRDGQTFIAIHERRIEVIVEKIINTVVVEEYIVEVPVETVVERVVTEFIDREVPVTVFVDRTVEVIKEVTVEVIKEVPIEVIKEVPVETIVKEIETVYIEVPVEVIKEVPVETIVKEVETVYVEVPAESTELSVTEGAVYTEDGYNNPPDRYHRHTFTHTHHGARHTHRFAHPDGEVDDWEADANRSHDGFAGLKHD